MIKLPGFRKQTGFASPIILTVALILLAAVGAGIYYFVQIKSPSDSTEKNQAQTQSQSPMPTKPAENKYEGEDFSIVIPEGWDKSQQPLPGTLLALYKNKEDHTDDPNAQKINFKSYMAVSFDRIQGKTKSQILDMIRQSLLQLSPNAKINALPEETVDNQTADLLKINLTQQDVNFKVLVAIVIKGDKYFTLSANTTEKKMGQLQGRFLQSFKKHDT